MKLHRRILSLLIVGLMLIAPLSALASSFTDVPSNHNNYMAIEIFSSLGLLKGYEDQTFHPDQGITRAEFTALIIRVLGLGDISGLVGLPFHDVADSHWAYSNIKLASDMNLVSGYPDGTFRPDTQVTYEQAIKLVVCALGYGEKSENMGGYPTGYLAQASSMRLLENVSTGNYSVPATRGSVSQILYNALEVPMVEYQDGIEEPTNKTLLRDYLKLTKITGTIDANEHTGIRGATRVGKGFISIDGKPLELEEKYNSYVDKLGYQVVAYYQNNASRGSAVVRSIFERPGFYKEVVIDAKNIASRDGGQFSYWTDDAHEGSIVNVTIPETASIVYNMKNMSYRNFIAGDYYPETGSVKLLDSDYDGVYDVITVKAYQNYAVKLISDRTIYNELGTPSVFTIPENDGVNTLKITKAGVASDYKSIIKGDILTVLCSEDRTYCDISISSRTLTGKISQTVENSSVTINGGEYLYSPELKQYLKSNNITSLFTIGTSVKFYLNSEGQICWYSLDSSAGETINYGYLISAGKTGVLSTQIMFRIFLNNRVLNYAGAKDLKVDGTTNMKQDDILQRLSQNALLTNRDLHDPANPDTVTEVDLQSAKFAQVVRFSVNKSGEIDYLDTITRETNESEDSLKMPEPSIYNKDGLKYNSSARNFENKVTVDSATKVFFVPTNRSDEKSYSLKTISSFSNNKAYVIETFDLSVTKIGKVVILYGASDNNKITVSSPQIIVKSVSQELVEDEAVQKLTGINMSGSTVTYYTENLGVLDDVKPGQIIRFAVNALGKLTNYDPVSLELDPYVLKDSPPPIPIPGVSDYKQPLRYKEYNSAGGLMSDQGENFSAYYRSVFATVVSADETSILVSSNLPTEDVSVNQSTYSVDSTTKFVLLDRSKLGSESAVKVISSTAEGLAKLIQYVDAGSDASQIYLYSSEGRLKFVYIIQ